jgi:hypothetical protein
MGPSRTDVKGHLPGSTFWSAVHKDIVEKHHGLYILIIILSIILLSALAAYLLMDIARHSSLPPFGNGRSQDLFPTQCSFSIPHNDLLPNASHSQEQVPTLNGTALQEMVPSLSGAGSHSMMSALNGTTPQETIPTLNATGSEGMIPSREEASSPKRSFEALFPISLQSSAASLAAGISSLSNAGFRAGRSLCTDGTISRITASAKEMQESLWQWPTSINSWSSPYLTPVLKLLGEDVRKIGDQAKGISLPRANFSLKL